MQITFKVLVLLGLLLIITNRLIHTPSFREVQASEGNLDDVLEVLGTEKQKIEQWSCVLANNSDVIRHADYLKAEEYRSKALKTFPKWVHQLQLDLSKNFPRKADESLERRQEALFQTRSHEGASDAGMARGDFLSSMATIDESYNLKRGDCEPSDITEYLCGRDVLQCVGTLEGPYRGMVSSIWKTLAAIQSADGQREAVIELNSRLEQIK